MIWRIHIEMSVAVTSVVVALIGIAIATWLYKNPNDFSQWVMLITGLGGTGMIAVCANRIFK